MKNEKHHCFNAFWPVLAQPLPSFPWPNRSPSPTDSLESPSPRPPGLPQSRRHAHPRPADPDLAPQSQTLGGDRRRQAAAGRGALWQAAASSGTRQAAAGAGARWAGGGRGQRWRSGLRPLSPQRVDAVIQ